MRTALLILAKDLRQRARDRTVWIVGIAAPLALAGVLGLIIGDFGAGVLPAPAWGVVVADADPVASSLVDGVLSGVADELGGEVMVMDDREAALQAVEDGELDAAFVLPRGLTGALAAGRVAEVEVLGEVGRDLANAVAQAVVQGWADEVAITSQAVRVAIQDGALAPADALQASQVAPGLVVVRDVVGADRSLDGSTQVAAGMGVFFLFFTVGLGVIGLLEERQAGTLARLQAAPTPQWSVVLGKVLTSIVIGYLATVVLLVATTLALGASWGPTIPVLVLILAAVVAAVSLVSIVASFAESADAANNVQGVIGIVLGMLGGAFFPVATEPGLLATASDLTPHGMFLTAIGDLQVPGAGLADIVPQLAGLLTFAVVTAAAGGALGRLREVA